MVFASADFSCFFVQIFFYAHVIGAKREYVALFFFVGQCFQLFGIGKTRNGIGHRFTAFFVYNNAKRPATSPAAKQSAKQIACAFAFAPRYN